MMPLYLLEQYCDGESARLEVVGGLRRLSVAICFSAIVQWQHLSFAQLQRRIMMCLFPAHGLPGHIWLMF